MEIFYQGSYTITSVSSKCSTGLHFLIILPIQGKKVTFRWTRSSSMESLSLSDFFSSIRHLGIRVRCGLCSLRPWWRGSSWLPAVPLSPCLLWDGSACLIFGHQPLPLHLFPMCLWADLSTISTWSSLSSDSASRRLPLHAVFLLRFHHTCVKARLWPTHSCCCKFSVSGHPGTTAHCPPLNPVPSCPSMNLSRAHGNSRLSSVPCWCPQGLVWRDVGVAGSLCLNLADLLCCSLLDLALEPLGVSVVQGPQGSSALDVEVLSILLGRWSQWAKSTRLIVHFYSKSFKLASIFKAHLWSPGKVPPLGTKGKISVFITCFKTRLLKI